MPSSTKRTASDSNGDVEMKDAATAAAAAAPSTPSTTSGKPKLNDSPSPSSGRQPIVYRWIGPGVLDPASGATVYTKLEMRVGGRAALIRTGDCALLCSGDVTEDVLYGGTPTAKGGGDDDGQKDVKMADANKNKDKDKDEDDVLYGGAATCFDDVAISQLDPFVARIERMWEDPEAAADDASPGAAQRREQDKKLLGTNYDERRSRMKIQARWFYKKEDISGLTSHFVGVSRKELLATMTPRELILGDQADDNEVSTILGKCRVVSRPPLPKKGGTGKKGDKKASVAAAPASEEAELPVGAFACRYGLTLHPPARAGAAGTVVFSPYDGQDPGLDEGDETGSSLGGTAAAGGKRGRGVGGTENNASGPASKRRRTDSDAASASAPSAPSSPPTSRRTSDAGRTTGSSSSSDEEEIANETDTGEGPPATEGSQLHGSIHVGMEHQVIIPPLNKDLALKDRGAVRVWSPESVSEEQVNAYLEKAAEVLKSYMKQRGLEADPSTTIYEFEKGLATAAPSRDNEDGAAPAKSVGGENSSTRKPRTAFRECDVDKMLATFHECNYNADNAIKAIEIAPEEYLTLWNKQQKELFNAGFRRYYGSLRMIGKGVGRSKGHKDVVDYFYRFKIPEQFCKYKDRKREQAKRILQTVEKRRMRDALAAEGGDDAKSVTSVGAGGSKKAKDLSKTLGSPSTVGQVEQRRVMARDLLSVIRDTIGPQNYLKICKLLKANQSRKGNAIPGLRDRAEELLGDHPELFDRFVAFLPKKHR